MKRAALLALLTACAIQANAAIKVFMDPLYNNNTNIITVAGFYDTGSMSFVDKVVVTLPTDNSVLTMSQAIAYYRAAVYTEAALKGYTITDADFIAPWPIIGFSVTGPTFTYPSRSLNAAFQISSTQNARVNYSVNIACTLSLTTGQSGSVVLEYADDSGFTTNVQTVQTSANTNTGTLAIGLNLTQTVTATVSGEIPAGKYVRIRTVSTTGSPTFTAVNLQEVLY